MSRADHKNDRRRLLVDERVAKLVDDWVLVGTDHNDLKKRIRRSEQAAVRAALARYKRKART